MQTTIPGMGADVSAPSTGPMAYSFGNMCKLEFIISSSGSNHLGVKPDYDLKQGS